MIHVDGHGERGRNFTPFDENIASEVINVAEDNVKNFNEYLLENVQAVRDETRQFKQDISKRMDGLDKRMDRLETRMDKLEDKLDKLSDKLDTSLKEMNSKLDTSLKEMNSKLDTSLKEIRQLVAESQKDIRSTERHSQILTSTIVSIVVVVLFTLLKGQ